MRTFKCQFSKDLTCEMSVIDGPPEKGQIHIQKVEWTGTPSHKNFRSYIAWVNSINKILADEWGYKIIWGFETGPGNLWDVWLYEPGKPPKLIGKMPNMFPPS